MGIQCIPKLYSAMQLYRGQFSYIYLQKTLPYLPR